MTQTDPRLSWLSSVGMHVVLLLLMLLWGRLQPPLSLPKPAPIHLTLIDQPALTMRQGAPGPATGPQQVKSAVRAPGAPTPRQVVTPAQPKQTERRADAQTTRTVAPKVTKQAATVRPAAQAVPRPQGDFRAALAKRNADQAAQEQGRLAQLGGSGPGVIQGTGGGDAGSPGGELSGRHLVHEVRPTYPQAALSDKVSGRVVVAIVVAPDGSVRRTSVSASSGDGRLDQAARSAVAQWRFAPLPDDLPAMDSPGTVPVTFWFRKG